MKNLLITLITLISLSLSAQTDYFVSPTGSDAANGLSEGTAWQTISHVNTQTFSAGDSIKFEAGGIWREFLNITESGTSGNHIVYTKYGTGINPRIYGSELAETWTITGTSNIWESATALINPRATYPGEIFFITNDSTTWGDFQTYDGSFTQLSQEFDWTWDNNTVYVYSTTDPDATYDSIEVIQRNSCMRMLDNNAESYITIDAINMSFGRSWGLNCGYPATRGATDLQVRNCTIGYIGAKGSSAAYGLAPFHSNFIAEDNVITDCGRRGISFNLYLQRAPGTYRNISNVVVRNNLFMRGQHTTGLDLACTPITGDTLTDVYFYGNEHYDQMLTMTGGDATSNQIFTQSGGAYFNNIYVYSNLFVGATGRNILIEGGDSVYIWNNTIVGHNQNITAQPFSNISFNNVLQSDYQNNLLYQNLPDNALDNYGVLMEFPASNYINKDFNLYYQEFENSSRGFTGGYEGYYNSSQWLSYLSNNLTYDQNSPTPQNPDFIDYANLDFKLSPTSAGNDAGTPLSKTFIDPLGVTVTLGEYDLEGNPRSLSTPAIGAYETLITDSTATNITSFSIPNQISSVINAVDSAIAVTVAYGYDVSSVIGTFTLSPLATGVPTSGTSQNYTTPLTIDVTANKGNSQEWEVTVTAQAAPPTPPSLYNVKRVKFGGSRRVINGKYVNFSK